MPGATVDLAGKYSITGETLDFTGHARLQAKVSQMTTGWKSILLRPVNRMFERDGAGVDVPITIKGTREKPDFKVDFGAVLRRF